MNVQAAPDRRVQFTLPAVGRITIAFGDQLKTLEVWTPPDQPLVCVEPWVGPSNTINTPDRVLLPPGGRTTFWMSVSLTK